MKQGFRLPASVWIFIQEKTHEGGLDASEMVCHSAKKLRQENADFGGRPSNVPEWLSLPRR
ncbi:hypothetical protein AB3R30_10725 [Leptolyngbyaceae cyanobacterium UHCC 1019]